MKDKYASRGGVAASGALVRIKLKFLIPASMLLVFVVWNSSSLSPLDATSSAPALYGAESEAFNSYTTLQRKEGNNVQDARSDNEVLKTKTKATAAQSNNLMNMITTQITQEEAHSASSKRATAEAPPQTEEAPSQIEEEAPSQIEEEAPAQIEEEAPAQIEEEAPAQTEEESPTRTEEEAPAQTEEEAPAQTEEEAPAQTEEEAPAQIEEEAPAQIEEEAPAQIEEEAPTQTEEEAPAQTEEAHGQTEEEAHGQIEEEAPAEIRDEASAQTEESRDAGARQEASRNLNTGRTEEEEAALAASKEEAAKPIPLESQPTRIDPEILPFIFGNKTHLAGADLWKLNEMGLELKFFEEAIRSVMLPYSTRKDPNEDNSCEGRHVYVYDLPAEFNKDLVAQCDTLFPWFNLCPYLVESGRGVPVNAVDNGTQIFVPGDRWFNTNQYALEMISHARVLKYKCLTDDTEKADLFYIPFYAGLDIIRWNFDLNTSNYNRDLVSLKLVSWLEQQAPFQKRKGADHVLVLGKISWDFRRQDGHMWGNKLLEIPQTSSMTRLMIERAPWAGNDIAVPHPTYFHPESAADIDSWLAHVRAQKRPHLVTFVGKERKNDPTNPRTALVNQCKAAGSEIDCKFVECNGDVCLHPAFVTKAFLSTDFCMQPPGDSPTRRSVFDSLIAGCIPVLFTPTTAYLQYPWHLPRNESSWSVYISQEDVIKGTASVVDTLKKISVEQRKAMRDFIINTMVPGLLYSAPGADVFPYRDAFDITMDQLLYRVKHAAQLDVSY